MDKEKIEQMKQKELKEELAKKYDSDQCQWCGYDFEDDDEHRYELCDSCQKYGTREELWGAILGVRK